MRSFLFRVADIALVLLQWILVLFGLLLIVIALNTYAYESRYFATQLPAAPGQDHYVPPVFQRLLTGVLTGAISVGLGAILFYLRRITTVRKLS